VVFEVVTEDGSLDIGKWASPSPKSSDNSEQAIVPKTKSTAVTEVEIIGIKYHIGSVTVEYTNIS